MADDLDDYFLTHASSCEVFEEEDDEETIRSTLVGPNGEPIYYHAPSTKQGFIGFVAIDDLHLYRAPAPRRKRTKKRST